MHQRIPPRMATKRKSSKDKKQPPLGKILQFFPQAGPEHASTKMAPRPPRSASAPPATPKRTSGHREEITSTPTSPPGTRSPGTGPPLQPPPPETGANWQPPVSKMAAAEPRHTRSLTAHTVTKSPGKEKDGQRDSANSPTPGSEGENRQPEPPIASPQRLGTKCWQVPTSKMAAAAPQASHYPAASSPPPPSSSTPSNAGDPSPPPLTPNTAETGTEPTDEQPRQPETHSSTPRGNKGTKGTASSASSLDLEELPESSPSHSEVSSPTRGNPARGPDPSTGNKIPWSSPDPKRLSPSPTSTPSRHQQPPHPPSFFSTAPPWATLSHDLFSQNTPGYINDLQRRPPSPPPLGFSPFNPNVPPLHHHHNQFFHPLQLSPMNYPPTPYWTNPGHPGLPPPPPASHLLLNTPGLPLARPAINSQTSEDDPVPSPKEMWAILRAIPSRADLQAIVTQAEEARKADREEVQQQLTQITERVTTIEQIQPEVERRLTALETNQTTQFTSLSQQQSLNSDQITMVALQQDDLENRHRRNNVRIRGLPEATTGPDLAPTVQGIFNSLLNKPPTNHIELDRTHRTPGPRNQDPLRPRDVVCRIHFYTVKEEILRKAWEKGPIDFDGASITILPDVSRRTLQMRRTLRPLLDLIKNNGATYRWGFPFHLIIKKGNNSFTLRSPENLPDLFQFLRTDPIQVPNWLSLQELLQPPPTGPRDRRPADTTRRRDRSRPPPPRPAQGPASEP